MRNSNNNIYRPFTAVIRDIVDIGSDVKLFKVLPSRTPLPGKGKRRSIDYSPGQFFMVGRWGIGEVPISVTSTPVLQKHIELAIRKVGAVTAGLHELKKGDTLWMRGPFGNGFGTAAAKGEAGALLLRDVIFIAGGVGIVPLRPLINLFLMHKTFSPPSFPPALPGRGYGKARRAKGGCSSERIFLLYGSKTPADILFKRDITAWRTKGVHVIVTVDKEDASWKGNVGTVTEFLDKVDTDFSKSGSYVCGPEIMIEKAMKALALMGMSENRIITTLEARMKCGTGKCGQCYRGTEYVCTNGPVYSYAELKKRKVYGP